MHLHLVLCIVLFNMFLFGYFSVFLLFLFFFFSFFFHIKLEKKNLKKKKYKNSVCFVYNGTCVYLGWPLKQSFLNFVSFVA